MSWPFDDIDDIDDEDGLPDILDPGLCGSMIKCNNSEGCKGCKNEEVLDE